MERELKKRNIKAEAVRKAGGAAVEMLDEYLKHKMNNTEREGALCLVAEAIEKQAREIEGTASGFEQAWNRGQSPDPIKVRALAILFGQGALHAQ